MKWIFVVESPTEIRDLKILTPIWIRWNRRELFQMWKNKNIYIECIETRDFDLSNSFFIPRDTTSRIWKSTRNSKSLEMLQHREFPSKRFVYVHYTLVRLKRGLQKIRTFVFQKKRPIQKVKTFTKIRFTCASWF